MLRGLYTVATVLEQNNNTLDVMSNNLANINSAGYKRDVAQYEEFSSVLLSKVNGNRRLGQSKASKVLVEPTADSQILTADYGYFKIDTAGGTSYNHSVELRAGKDGILRTLYRNGNHQIIEDAGYPVLGQNGPVQVGDQPFEVDEAGRVLVDGKVVDTLVFKRPAGVLGTYSGGIRFNRVVTDFEQAELQRTDNAFNLALNAKGFFTVDTPFGVRYTRNGQFKVNSESQLVTNEGYQVLGLNGPITLSKNDLTVNRFGEVLENGFVVDKLQIVNPANIERMKKFGASLYRFDGDMNEQNFTGQVLQGFLENSNVNGLREMIQIMETYRAYESAQRVVRSYDDTLGKAVSEVGRL